MTSKNRQFLVLCIAVSTLSPLWDAAWASPSSSAQTQTKRSTGTKHRPKTGRYRHASAFVPPPPASSPSILPEIVARRMHATDTDVDNNSGDEEEKPVNPYSQYIKTPEGDAPTPIESRKGVVIWNHRG